jgi:hypothetical protein
LRLLAIRRIRTGQGADEKKTCDDPVCRAFHMKSRHRSGPGLVESTRHDVGRRLRSPRHAWFPSYLERVPRRVATTTTVHI